MWGVTSDQRQPAHSSTTLGHEMSLAGGHLTEGQPAHSSTTLGHETSLSLLGVYLVYVTKVITHMATRCLCLGRLRLTFCLIGSHPASQLAICNGPANQPCDKISTCQAFGWSGGGRKTRNLTTLDPSPGSQHSHWFPLGE